jgi:hypothetical protein
MSIGLEDLYPSCLASEYGPECRMPAVGRSHPRRISPDLLACEQARGEQIV